jgi:hypothetical protein
MMLDLHALDLHLPAAATHTSLLGARDPFTYKHLFDKAGRASRPPTVRRGIMSLPCDAFAAPTAAVAERTTDMASLVVGRLLERRPAFAERIGAILHAQCTLDQQMLSSTCMRLRCDHLPNVPRYATIGQLGTAALPTALRLAACPPLPGSEQRPLTCVSASDKWIAPFVQVFPGLLTFGDAAAACLVGPGIQSSEAIAHVIDMELSTRPLAQDLWTAPAAMQADLIVEQLQACAETLLSRVDLSRDGLVLIGDGTEAPIGERLAERLRIACLPPAATTHLSSAAALFSIGAAIGAAAAGERAIDALIWTASPGGQAAVMLVRCRPDAVSTATGWAARS